MIDEVIAQLREWEQDIVDLASRLVATLSPTPPGDERQVAPLLLAELEALGLENISVFAKEPERPNVVCRIGHSADDTGHSLILNGHIDTKPVGDAKAEWEIKPLTPTLKDGRLYGLGTTYMNGAIAAIVYAGAAISRARLRLPGELLLVFYADEEGGSCWEVLSGRGDRIARGRHDRSRTERDRAPQGVYLPRHPGHQLF